MAPPGPPFRKRACAACKHQRRRCPLDCPLFPHFTGRTPEFNNVHRLFGIKYVLYLLKKLAPLYHTDAMNSIIYEAHLRATYPVGGCCAVIAQLQHQIALCETKLNYINQNIALYKEGLMNHNNQEMEFGVQENVAQQFPNDNNANNPTE